MSQRAWFGVVGFLFLVVGCGRGNNAAKTGGAGTIVQTVEVAKAVEEDVERRVEITGTLAPWEEGLVPFEADGTVIALLVDLGDSVKKGQVLARIDPREYRIRKEQAEAEVAAAELDYGRLTQLVANDMATKQQVDEGRRRLNVTRTAVDLLGKKLADTEVRAPVDGAVSKRYANAGEYVRTGNPAFQVVRSVPLKLKGEVPERNASQVHVGDVVTVTSESIGKALTGTISRIGPSVAIDSRSFPVEARIENPDGVVKPGTFARASILVAGTVRGVLVPDVAVLQFAGNSRVFVVVDGKVQERTVELGTKAAGSRILVKKGVAAGESVVVTGGSLLSDGATVVVR